MSKASACGYGCLEPFEPLAKAMDIAAPTVRTATANWEGAVVILCLAGLVVVGLLAAFGVMS